MTERLVVRCWSPADAPLLKEAIDSSLDSLRRWMPWAAAEPTSIEEKVALLRRFRGRFDLGKDFVYGIFDPAETEVIGGTGLHTRAGTTAFEIGYWIRDSRVGKGYATEIAAALTRVAIEVCGVDRVEIRVDPANTRQPRDPAEARVHGGGDAARRLRRDGPDADADPLLALPGRGRRNAGGRRPFQRVRQLGRPHAVSRSGCGSGSSAPSTASGCATRPAASGCAWEDPRIRVVPVAGISYRAEAAADESFDPGRRLALVPEPENEHDPNAVAIWNAERTLQAGYVPAAVAPELAGDEQAVSLWRVEGGLRVLLAPADAWIGTPRWICLGATVGWAAVAYEFKLPDLGEGLTEGEIARWLVAEGQEIAEDDPLVEIQTDKTTVEIPSPAAGTVRRILVAEGDVVPVGTVLVEIGGDGDGAGTGRAAPPPRRRSRPSRPRRPRASLC